MPSQRSSIKLHTLRQNPVNTFSFTTKTLACKQLNGHVLTGNCSCPPKALSVFINL
jgi:hypothetical protein